MFQRNNRHFLQTKLSGGQQTTMARNHIVLTIHKNRCAPTKLADAGRNLRDLDIRVLLGIAGIRNQRIDRTVVNLQRAHRYPEMKKPAESKMLKAGLWCWPVMLQCHLALLTRLSRR